MKYPSGREVSVAFDGMGRPNQIWRGASVGGTCTTEASCYVRNVSYAPQGAVSGLTLGNGIDETTVFNNRLQPVSMQTAAGAQQLLNLGLCYAAGCTGTGTDNNGNVVQQKVSVPKSDGSGLLVLKQVYGFDAVNRLVSTSETVESGATAASWSLACGHGVYGNSWVEPTGTTVPLSLSTRTAESQFNLSTNRLAKQQNGTDLPSDAYDLAGNLQNHPSAVGRMSYDAENRLMAVGTVASFAYDGEGRRVKKIVGTATTTFVYDAFGALAAEYGGASGGGGTRYLSSDHLGSVRLVTDAAAGVVSRTDYFPYGEEIPASASYGHRELVSGYNVATGIAQKFTSKERDAETGLDYFGARYMSSAQGRFTTPDTPLADQHAADPQSWNLYGYVRNNPLRFVDAGGRECVNGVSSTDSSLACYANDPDPLITNPSFTAVAAGASRAAPYVEALAVATVVVPAIATGAAALLGASPITAATVGTAGVAAAETPQGQQAISGLLPAAQNGAQWAGEITSSVTQTATTMFRVWGDKSEQVGAWLTPNLPASANQAVSSLSLPPGNSAAFVSEVLVPAGARIQSGAAGPLFQQPGGGAQVLLLQYLPRVNFGPGVPLK